MKRIIAIAAVLLLFVTGCGSTSGGAAKIPARTAKPTPAPPPPGYEWLEKDAFYMATYDALANNNKSDADLVSLLSYDYDKEHPYFTLESSKTAEDIAALLAPVWNGSKVPMFGAVGEADVVLGFFASFDCVSIAVSVDSLAGKENTIADIKFLRTLEYDHQGKDANLYEALPPAVYVDELCLSNPPSAGFIIDTFKEVQRLTLKVSSDEQIQDLEEIFSGTQLLYLREIMLLKADGSEVEPTAASVLFFRAAMENPSIELINGVPKDEFEIEDSEALRALVERERLIEEATSYCEDMYEQVKKGEIRSSRGKMRADGPLLLYIDGMASVTNAWDGLDFEGFPAGRLAKSVEEAGTLILFYASYEDAGTYTNGDTAYKTYTMVAAVDIASGDIALHCVGTSDPPKQIEIINGRPSTRSGELLLEEAIDYALGLL